ncbi:MAG TPA: DUF3617 family protein [Hyphomicrobiaceae bacterium]|nr:DUF3617 family protein [Hyphomicrobiaceae bacterium]
MNRPIAVLLGAAALTMPFALAAQTLDLPARKAGLWDISTVVEKPAGMPTVTAQMCLDPATDRDLMDHALKLTGGNCTSLTTKSEGRTLIINAECTFAGKATKSRTVISGDFKSAYTARTEATMGRGDKVQATVTTQTAAWKSADCPGMKPGDITMFGGVKVNVKQLKALSGLIR